MAINKAFFNPTTKIVWNDVEVCTVRGLTPDDIAQAMSENAADMELLMETFERDSILAKVDVTQDEQLSAALAENTGKMFSTLITQVPNLVAKLIALACDDPGEWEYVKRTYVVPLQFDILTAVAKLTFVDTNGFKAFVGNVVALMANVGGQQRKTTTTPNSTLSPPDTVG